MQAKLSELTKIYQPVNEPKFHTALFNENDDRVKLLIQYESFDLNCTLSMSSECFRSLSYTDLQDRAKNLCIKFKHEYFCPQFEKKDLLITGFEYLGKVYDTNYLNIKWELQEQINRSQPHEA